MPETATVEWSILLTAASAVPLSRKQIRLRSLLEKPVEPVRWKLLFSLADQHGLQPLLQQALFELPAELPAEDSLLLKQCHQTNLHKAMLLSRELIRVVDHLGGMGIEVMPYKGLALAELLYGDIALRQAGDIDLLIRTEDFCRAREAVGELGYTPHDHFSGAIERSHMKSGYECAFDGNAGCNLLEVQWALQPRFYAIDFDMAGLFDRAMTLMVAGQSMKTPSLEDLLLTLSAHAAKHVWGRMIWLCDLARIIAMPNLNWTWIRTEAEGLGLLRILRVTMLAANRLLDADIPAPAKQEGLADADAVSITLAKEIETYIRRDTPFNIESVAYFRLMMRLRERPADRRRFLTRLMFTPGPSEWAAVRLPQPLFPLYSFVRLSRLAARVART